jgi:hypothetical protein
MSKGHLGLAHKYHILLNTQGSGWSLIPVSVALDPNPCTHFSCLRIQPSTEPILQRESA